MAPKKQHGNGDGDPGRAALEADAKRRWMALFPDEAPAAPAAATQGTPHDWTADELKDLKTVRDALRATTAAETHFSGGFTAADRSRFIPGLQDRMDAYGRYKRLLGHVRDETASLPKPFRFATEEPPEKPRTQVDARGTITVDRASYDTLKSYITEKSLALSANGAFRN